MSNPKSDIFKFPQVCVVEASAGSGKTYTLAKRYISLLINPYLKEEEIPLQSILAITFTNKAAFEMKARILEFLKKIALDKFDSANEKNDILSSFCVNESLARSKAYKIMDEIIRNYNFFQVSTIDSFINAILSGCAFRLNLSSNFKTEKKFPPYLEYSLDKLIDKVPSDPEVALLFEKFLKQYINIERKTNWFPKKDILSIIGGLFFQSNKYAQDFSGNNIETRDLTCLRKTILEEMRELSSVLPVSTHKTFSDGLKKFLQENRDSFDIDDVSEYFKRDVLPVKKGEVPGDKQVSLWISIKENLRRLCESESASIFNYYIDIFSRIRNDLINIAESDDIIFLEALNKQARRLFNDESFGLPELYIRLSLRFKHFLLDEFQDTSSLQWENIFVMVEDALSGKGSLFYVGDKKQAIYRFRGGDVSLIDSLRKRFSGFNIIEQRLKINYRSLRQIVEFNNMVFSEDNLNRFLNRNNLTVKSAIEFSAFDIDEILSVFKEAFQQCKDDASIGYVQAEIVEFSDSGQKEQILKEKVLSVLEDLRVRFSLKDIAFLVRKNEEAELLTTWLIEKNIPVESEHTLDIRQNPYIKELISLLTFLNSPIDNLSFASCILGDLFLQASGLSVIQVRDFIFEYGAQRTRGAYLYREFRTSFPEIWEELFEGFFKSAGFVPLYELVISILHKFKVMGNFSCSQGFFMKFLELIKDQEEESCDIGSFLEYFSRLGTDEMYVNVAETEAVKILTIHKSKGLEFRAVVIPFLEMDVRLDTCVVDANAELNLFYLKKKYTLFSELLEEMYRREYLKAFIDELNSIYVAFTRAIEELRIFIPSPARGCNIAGLLLPDNFTEQGIKRAVRKETAPVSFKIDIPVSSYSDWIHILKDECAGIKLLRLEDTVLRGEVMHYVLSFIGNLSNSDVSLALDEAVAKARVNFDDFTDFVPIRKKAESLLKDKSLEKFFYASDAQVYNEKEFIDSSGLTKRIDRFVVSKDAVFVIDYKSSRLEAISYQKQVSEYVNIIQEVYPRHEVKGVIIYLDDLSIEEVGR